MSVAARPSQLQHANVALPAAWDQKLAALFVTPNFHRVHHSKRRREADSNFGTIFSIWDRISGTLTELSPERVAVGSPDGAPGEVAVSFLGILGLPFEGIRAASSAGEREPAAS